MDLSLAERTRLVQNVSVFERPHFHKNLIRRNALSLSKRYDACSRGEKGMRDRRFIEGTSFDPTTLFVISTAFDRAWSEI